MTAVAPAAEAGGYLQNRAPLIETSYLELPIGAIRADGWLKLQLEAQRSGLTGDLDEIYPNVVGSRNAWLGGDGDAWERGPYWIDGLLPLAYLLDDDALKAKAQVWVEAILNSQTEEGYFGPSIDRDYEPGLQRNNSHDWWPKMVALKILKQYYMATSDGRVIPFLDKYFRYQLKHLPETPLGHWTFWGEQRGGDNLEIVYWLYNLTGEEYLLELGELIHSQCTPWTAIFTDGNMLYTQNSMHCVNLGQGFKEPVVYYQQSRDHKYLDAMENGLSVIRRTIGLPTGLWAGDELINYGEPSRGSELCTAVEMMFSLEEMVKITGDLQWADYLERVAYNALPTQVTDDCSARQYFQQTNQIECSRVERDFSTPHRNTDQVFGVLNGYPCCTTNMHQGWPKLTQNLWYATDDCGIAAMVYAPSTVTAMVADGVEATVKEETFYPFDENIRMTVNFTDKKVKGAFFPIKLRIPGWCRNAVIKINGEKVEGITTAAGSMVPVRRNWKRGDVITLELPMDITCSRWYDGAAVIERGPLLYALKMNETWTRKEFAENERITYGEWYYEVKSDSKWNYCLSSSDITPEGLEKKFSVVRNDTDRTLYPWNLENAPLTIIAPARELYDWTGDRGSVGRIAYFTQQYGNMGPETTIELIPYGCTTLRIAEFPVRH